MNYRKLRECAEKRVPIDLLGKLFTIKLSSVTDSKIAVCGSIIEQRGRD